MELSNILSILAIIISFGAVGLSKKYNSMVMGQLEIMINQSISDIKIALIDSQKVMTPLLAKQETDKLSLIEEKELEIHGSMLETAIENNLNSYESACTKYIDKKVDIERFKRTIHTEIKRLVENEDYEEKYFKPNTI